MRKKTIQIIVIKERQEKIRFEPCSHYSRMYTSKTLSRDATWTLKNCLQTHEAANIIQMLQDPQIDFFKWFRSAWN